MNDDSSSKTKPNTIQQRWRRWLQRVAGAPHTRDDLLEILKFARGANLMDADALSMFQGVLGTSETQVRDIMVPRAQMVIVERDWSLEKIRAVVVESGHSRFPVIGDSKDEVVGILLANGVIRLPDFGRREPAVSTCNRET